MSHAGMYIPATYSQVIAIQETTILVIYSQQQQRWKEHAK